MDIRTKLIFALVAASLGSMFVFGAVVAPRVEGYIRDGTLERLDELAEAKREALRWIIAGWRDGTELVASRTQLRASLDDHTRTGARAPVARIRAILNDAITASRSLTFLQVYDADGGPVASATRGVLADLSGLEIRTPPPPGDQPAYVGIAFTDSGSPQVAFQARMAVDGRTIGTLLAVFDAQELVELSTSHSGLGETGETLILARDGSGALRTLHRTRHGGGTQGAPALSGEMGGLGALPLSDTGPPVSEGITDYRGAEVWAAARPVPEVGWRVVVKEDRAEGMRTAEEFRAWLRRTALVLSAFAILIGAALGLRFALPIHGLAEVANRIRRGEMDARADETRQDEVGVLARTFNQMADELETRMSLLREFRKFFDVSIDLMCIAGTDGYFKRTNPSFERVLGWNQDELLNQPFLAIVHPDDVDKTWRELEKLSEGIPTISFENRFRCRDGSYRLLRWTSYPQDGVLYAIAHVLDDAPES
ncbi:MAG: PAS domain S-box protein [Gemmatimonadota bacterium]